MRLQKAIPSARTIEREIFFKNKLNFKIGKNLRTFLHQHMSLHGKNCIATIVLLFLIFGVEVSSL
jgi:hypothetical protein